MKRTHLGLITIAAATLLWPSLAAAQEADPVQASSCTINPADVHLTYDEFDGENAAWRKLSDRGCDLQAADLIAQYRAAHHGTLSVDSVKLLNWHEGQLRAAVDDYAAAITLFSAVLSVEAESFDRLYTEATLAFLRRDEPALIKARDDLKGLPEPPAFARAADRYAAEYGLPRPVWPPNLDVVENLVACFDQPYRVAYRACNANQ